MEVITRYTNIHNFTYMTRVIVNWVISYDLIDTFLGQLIGLTSLHLKHRPFLFCCQNLWMFGVDVHIPDELIDGLSWKEVFQELKYTENFIFFGCGDVRIEIS